MSTIMPEPRRPHLGRAIVLAAASVLFAAFSDASSAASINDWVGYWNAETVVNRVYEGKPYAVQRELEVYREDGTETATFQYYDGNTLVGATTATYLWGINGDVFWNECRTLIVNGTTSPCSVRHEYDVVSATSREIRYKSRTTGTVYSATRVAPDFRLP